MNKPIQVGDMVAVVRWGCCVGQIGLIFKIGRIEPVEYGRADCGYCGARVENFDARATTDTGKHSIPLGWLQRINPPAVKTSTRTEETLKETA